MCAVLQTTVDALSMVDADGAKGHNIGSKKHIPLLQLRYICTGP